MNFNIDFHQNCSHLFNNSPQRKSGSPAYHEYRTAYTRKIRLLNISPYVSYGIAVNAMLYIHHVNIGIPTCTSMPRFLTSQNATGVTPLLAYSQKNGDLKQNTNKRIRKWSKTDVQNILYLFNDNRSESDFLGTTSHKTFLKHIIHTIFCTS